MLEVIASDTRGTANFGWLQSQHTFSFGSYYDPNRMGFSALRVINDDKVAPSAGFETHGHRDMEIISYVTQGSIAHKDSTGNEIVLPAGEFQLMSAGKGIFHSEFNASSNEPLHFLQIWIKPSELGGAPGYQQKHFPAHPGLSPVITPDGREGTLRIKQDAYLYQLQVSTDTSLSLPLHSHRAYYMHVVKGDARVNGQRLSPGDGLKVQAMTMLEVQATADLFALWFDLPPINDIV